MIDLPEASLAEVRRILAAHLPDGCEVRVFGSRERQSPDWRSQIPHPKGEGTKTVFAP